jgi:endonuclease/exonuclease/phosphatase family metal-dependent hydrolase
VKRILITYGFLLLLGIVACTPPPTREIEQPKPPTPEITFRIATLDMAQQKKRLEKRDVEQLANILMNEHIDVLTVQNVVRYPGLQSRIDFVTELARASDLRFAFGEMSNVGGKQMGNAIFSIYPIISHHTITFETVASSSFEGGLTTTIDIGATPLNVISAQLPPKLIQQKKLQCLSMLLPQSKDTSIVPHIITGNLLSVEQLAQQFSSTPVGENRNNSLPQIWKALQDDFKQGEVKTLSTSISTLVIVDFQYYRQGEK